jgi:lipoprotein-anchoring transpeptidase ErfK/SrfK
MKNLYLEKLFKSKKAGNFIILTSSVVLIYLIISIYFASHFFFNTMVNGVNLSLKAHKDAEHLIKSSIKDYKLQLIERAGEAEEITGEDIGLLYNGDNSISIIYERKNSFKWFFSLFRGEKHYVEDLFVYTSDELENKINQLNCLNKEIVEPQSVKFNYASGFFYVIEEIYGNRVNREKLMEAIEKGILKGERKLDLNEKLCYENPRYTLNSAKTLETKALLNKYVKTKIIYILGNEKEVLDGNIINQWLSVDENLDVAISEIGVMKYIRYLGRKYDTIGIARKFKTSMGKTVEVKGGLYGWKIDLAAETKALIENIKLGEVLEKEPIYAQRSLPRGENEIGNTYVEINITRQHLWFYKNGSLVTQGSIVTGNPNRGHATALGTYMLNYKQKDATLTGPDYEAPVTYWMPFFGNMGIHDATWRYSFGGTIYKRRGSHGCVNAPKYLAKIIFENIEAGTPIICYEE